MTDRIEKLCAYLTPCKDFADVGCDHGYCTLYMLENKLCKEAVFSDIGEKCLSKAERLLKDYIERGVARGICCNGLEKIPKESELVLIAGMGGEEITEILRSGFIPQRFVLQPMKNAEKVREYLITNGAAIDADEPFESHGKFYYVICGRRDGGSENYTKANLKFGKNLSGAATRAYIQSEIDKNLGYLARPLAQKARAEIEERTAFMQGVLKGEII